MGVKDTFNFNRRKYYDGKRNESNEKLIEKHRSKTSQFISTSMGIGGAVAVAVHTLGVSLVGGLYACRQTYVLHQQQAIIEHVLWERRHPLPRERITDIMIGVGVGVAAGGVGLMAPVAADHMVNMAAAPAIGSALTTTVHQAGASGSYFPGQDVFHHMGQGAQNAMSNQFHNGMVHYGQHIPGYHPTTYTPIPTQNPQLLGYDLGYDIIPQIDAMIGQKASNFVFERIGGYVLRRNL